MYSFKGLKIYRNVLIWAEPIINLIVDLALWWIMAMVYLIQFSLISECSNLAPILDLPIVLCWLVIDIHGSMACLVKSSYICAYCLIKGLNDYLQINSVRLLFSFPLELWDMIFKAILHHWWLCNQKVKIWVGKFHFLRLKYAHNGKQ